jgi:Putative RNA methylase family UPF0020
LSPAQVFLTTQPGWAFASLAELRQRGVRGYVPFFHRDSTLLAPAPPSEGPPLWTPGDSWGLLALAEAGEGQREDATARLAGGLRPARLREALARWVDPSAPRRYSVGSAVWGETALHRGTLRQDVQEALGKALPGWQAGPSGGVRFFCKADAKAALCGVRLASNLHPGEGDREGALREHLACGLLVLAGATAGHPVLDPFAGSGTILRAAWERFGVQTCLGYEVDGEALRLARRTVGAPRTRLVHDSFEACRPERLPPGTRLVSNLPFGARFAAVPLRRLGPFLERCLEHVAGMALLMNREQGQRVAQELDLGRKNVLVLGQPACIVYTPL